MRLTVCELPNDPDDFARAWQRLVDHVSERQSDLVLLPEMPFFRWLSQTNEVDPAEWKESVCAHDEWMTRLDELAPATVISSRPVVIDGTFTQSTTFPTNPVSGRPPGTSAAMEISRLRKPHRRSSVSSSAPNSGSHSTHANTENWAPTSSSAHVPPRHRLHRSGSPVARPPP